MINSGSGVPQSSAKVENELQDMERESFQIQTRMNGTAFPPQPA